MLLYSHVSDVIWRVVCTRSNVRLLACAAVRYEATVRLLTVRHDELGPIQKA